MSRRSVDLRLVQQRPDFRIPACSNFRLRHQEIGQRQLARPFRPYQVHNRIARRQRHNWVGRVGAATLRGAAKQCRLCMRACLCRRAPGPGCPLDAHPRQQPGALCLGPVIGTARALQKIATQGSPVPDLRRSGQTAGLDQRGKSLLPGTRSSVLHGLYATMWLLNPVHMYNLTWP